MAVPTSMVAGTRFGKYTLLRQLAIGGMAEIYLARADGIGQFAKQVVLKRILPQFASHEDFVEMFLHEARLAARLQHPNVVQVFDIGEADGSYFFTMEYVHGQDLRGVLAAARKRGERLPIDNAIAIAIGAAAGLHHAHEQLDDDGRPLDMVHRDISPSNIMLSFDGAAKVADFGIAKTSSQVIQTRSGVLKGKISYMSPEQCRSDPLDRRSDIFALGIVLHELVTGEKVFRGENEYAILRQIIEHDAPRLSQLSGIAIPAGLDDIVAHALARARERRHPTAQALQAELEALAREHRLDTSSISLARYLREHAPALAAPEPGTLTPATTPVATPPTSATMIEPQSTPHLNEEARTRPRRWLFGAALGTIAVAASFAFAMMRTESSPAAVTGEPVPITTTHADAAGADAHALVGVPTTVDAAVTPLDTEPVAKLPPAAGERPRPKPTQKPRAAAPTPASDPCAGWSPNSLSPPPSGCDPK